MTSVHSIASGDEAGRSWTARWLVGHAAVVLAAIAIGALIAPRAFDLDDAYISLHSARVLVDGYDRIFDAPALLGATNPPYVALLAGLIRVGLPDLVALRVAAAMSLASFIVALWYLGTTVALPVPRRAALIVLIIASGYTVLHATNGMETGFAMAIATVLIAAAVGDQPWLAASCAGLLPAFRPELAFVSVALLGSTLWRAPASRRVSIIAIALAAGLPWFVWLRIETGSWFPITIQAKALFFGESCMTLRDRAMMIARGFFVFGVVAMPGAIGLLGTTRATIGRLGLVAIALILGGFMLKLPTGVFHNGQRYLYPVLVPWCAFGWAEWARRFKGPTATVVLLTTAVCAVPLGWKRTPPRGEIAQSMKQVAEWVNVRTEPGAVLLVHDAGAVSVFGTRRAVDVVGLKTMSSVDAHRRWTYPTCGRERSKATATIARTGHADYLVALKEWDSVFDLSGGLRREGFDVQPVYQSANRTWSYTIYRLKDQASRTPRAAVANGAGR